MDIVYEALKKTRMTDNEAHEVASKEEPPIEPVGQSA